MMITMLLLKLISLMRFTTLEWTSYIHTHVNIYAFVCTRQHNKNESKIVEYLICMKYRQFHYVSS